MTVMAKPIATLRSAAGISTGMLAVWWLIASEIVIFGGLLASYLMHRVGHPEWADYASHTNTWIGMGNTFVLLTSSLFAVLAHQAADEHAVAARHLGGSLTGPDEDEDAWTHGAEYPRYCGP